MLTLLATLAFASCPTEPALRDPDGEVTILEQNLKFILTGTRRKARDKLLADYLHGKGTGVDVLLLSEARITSTFDTMGDDWCFYTQAADRDGYRWAPLQTGRPPGGLAMGIRQRTEGILRSVGTFAGRPFRAHATSLAEGVLGTVFGYHKGWAGLQIDDTHLVWSHTQASYARHPDVGAGGDGRGRAGQFDDLADDLGWPDKATLMTGDLNLLAGFWPAKPKVEARVKHAREIDDHTLARFQERTGLDFSWPWFGREARERRADVNAASADAAVPADAPQAPADAPNALDPAAVDPTASPDVGDVSDGDLAEGLDGSDAVSTVTLADRAGETALHPRRTHVGTFAGGIDRRTPGSAWDRGAAYDRVGVNAAFLRRHPGTRVRPVEIARGWLRVSDHLGLEITIPFSPARAPDSAPQELAAPALPDTRLVRVRRDPPPFAAAFAAPAFTAPGDRDR